MKESKPFRKFSKAKIEEARKRLDKSSRGSDEEYYAHLLAVNEELKILRRRANRGENGCRKEIIDGF